MSLHQVDIVLLAVHRPLHSNMLFSALPPPPCFNSLSLTLLGALLSMPRRMGI